jgi:hypothetical protein
MNSLTKAGARGRVACRATSSAKAAKLDLSRWRALNVTKMNLIDSQGGRTTRNIDGAVYDISYEAGSDAIVVVDKAKGLRYPAKVGDDNRVRIDLEAGEAVAVGLAMEPLQQVRAAGPPCSSRPSRRPPPRRWRALPDAPSRRLMAPAAA